MEPKPVPAEPRTDGSRDLLVSVVAPVWNDSPILGDFIDRTIAVLQSHYEYFELILVDDGSTDASAALAGEKLSHLPCIRLIRLSRRFGEEIAIYAGLETVIGDVVVTMLPGCDPPHLIPELVDRVIQHRGVVVGVRSSRHDSFTSQLGARLFYWICNSFLSMQVPENSTHFRALSRSALNALLQIKDKYRYLKVFSTYIGYQHQEFHYEPERRADQPRERGLLRSIDLAVNIMVAHSTRLLRLVTGLGVVGSGLNLLYMFYIVAIAVFKEDVAEGWITLSAQNAGMFFLLFVILTVLGEYVGRVLAETQDRPLYYVMEEQTSSVLLLHPEQKNVVTETILGR
ncbi:MAG TPA: glycosyltransferase family 2 protein [Rhodothermales bacterium]|nr:glycosyltransferase family 2 protein [Rhodothermales bacterium]